MGCSAYANQLLMETARELGAAEYTAKKYREALEAILRTGNLKEGHNTANGHALCKRLAREALGERDKGDDGREIDRKKVS